MRSVFYSVWLLGLIINCEGCLKGQFACANGGCISVEKKCDYVSDCTDGSDEKDCVYPCKSAHMKACRKGHCISTYFFCDGKNDCGDWSDEFNCTRLVASDAADSNPRPAPSFHCNGHICIPQNWVCDGIEDFHDGLDERHCTAAGECNKGFKCGKECILSQWVCDGEQDCADGSDEKECGPDAQYHHNCLPEHGWFRCRVKGVTKCIPIPRACDNFSDCEDRSDEGGQCGTNACNNIKCSHGCNLTPKGAVCSCPIGYKVNGTDCDDIDECQLFPPMCSQNCINLEGSFQCTCIPGYTLGSDNRTCVADGPEPVLFITTAREIRSLSLRSKDYALVRSGVSQAHSIAADDRFIYWAEKITDYEVGIYKLTLDGGALDAVVILNIEVVEDLDVDWVGRNIYFADSGRKIIAACNLHGTACADIISDGLDKPRGIAVHPQSRLLFWTDWGSHPHIGSAGMDGSDRKEIITTEIVWPRGVAVDDSLNRVYWSDAKLNRIESCQFDGSDRKVLQATVHHPYALDVFEDLVFWTDPVDHEVFSCNKFTGKNQQIIMKESSLTPTGLYVHHPSKQRQMLNPCRHGVCSHLCLLSPSTNGFFCPFGMTLNSDNRTCSEAATSFGCAANQFECHCGVCISAEYVCDGEYNCHDKSDEENCTVTCSPMQFYCNQSRLCIPNSWVCDGEKDCEQSEDESNCSGPLSCPANYIRCPSHTECIPRITLCDGADDCVHATNEQLCASLDVSHPAVNATSAPNGFSCYLIAYLIAFFAIQFQ